MTTRIYLVTERDNSDKPHGRKAWSLLLPGFSEVRWVDVSAFEPPPKPQPPRTVIAHPSNVYDD